MHHVYLSSARYQHCCPSLHIDHIDPITYPLRNTASAFFWVASASLMAFSFACLAASAAAVCAAAMASKQLGQTRSSNYLLHQHTRQTWPSRLLSLAGTAMALAKHASGILHCNSPAGSEPSDWRLYTYKLLRICGILQRVNFFCLQSLEALLPTLSSRT